MTGTIDATGWGKISGGTLIAILLGLMFHLNGVSVFEEVNSGSLFVWMFNSWKAVADTAIDYSHGFLIPIVSLFLVWKRKEEFLKAEKVVDNKVLFLVVAMLGLHWVGLRTQIAQLSALSLILLIWAIPFYLYGKHIAGLLFFPCTYLLFCIPMNFLENLSFPLRYAGTVVSEFLLNGLGIPVERVGTAIVSVAGGGVNLDVADPCSGLKSLIALASLSAVYAYLSQRTLFAKWLLFLSAIPFAITGNILRVITIAIVAAWMGQDVAIRLYHDLSGYFVFAVATILIVWTGTLMNRAGSGRRTVSGDKSEGIS